MHKRPFNFNAGPSMLPDSILTEAQAELMDWQGSGMSVMETGHRTDRIKMLMENIEQDLRSLLTIPKHYQILFLGCPARFQFSMIPTNFLSNQLQGAYLISGLWSSLAFQEAEKLSKVYCIGSNSHNNYTKSPVFDRDAVKSDTAYLYYTPNETINGVRIATPPQLENVPLIVDMTSCLLTETINVNDYGLIFAGAQKNISIAGLTIVIIRDDLLSNIHNETMPTFLDYRTHSQHKSLYATPPIFNCYLAGKMFEWIKDQGGVESLYNINCQKAAKLYQFIDNSDFYQCLVAEESRSIVNVCFSLVNQDLEADFIQQAQQQGLLALQGHRAVGGLRASLYNAMPMEGIDALINFMYQFSKENK